MSAAALNIHVNHWGRKKNPSTKKLLKRFNRKIERIFIKISHFHIVRIQDNKTKATLKKLDEGKLLHNVKNLGFSWVSG